MTTSSFAPIISDDDPSAADGPRAHEDLTIAEHVESMRTAGEHRPGEQCFINSHGESCCVSDEDVNRFLAEFGAEHPSDYFQQHGVDWEKDFLRRTK